MNVEIDPWNDFPIFSTQVEQQGFPKGVPGNHVGMTSYVQDVMEDVAGGYIQEGKDTYIAINPLSTSWLLDCL